MAKSDKENMNGKREIERKEKENASSHMHIDKSRIE